MADGNCGTWTCGQLADVIIEPSVKDVKVELPTHFTCGHVDACVDTGEDCDPAARRRGCGAPVRRARRVMARAPTARSGAAMASRTSTATTATSRAAIPRIRPTEPRRVNHVAAARRATVQSHGARRVQRLSGAMWDGVVGDGEVCDRDPATHQSTCTPGTGTSCTSDCTACVAVCGDGRTRPRRLASRDL